MMLGEFRERVVFCLAPWLRISADERSDIAAAWRELIADNKKMQATGRAILSEAGFISESFALAQALRYRKTLEGLLALKGSTDGYPLVANTQAREMAEHALDDEYWSKQMICPHGVAVSVSPCRGEGPGSTPGGGAQ